MEQTPYWADLAFPILSFLLTILAPSTVAVWVIYRVIRDFRRGTGAAADPSASGVGVGASEAPVAVPTQADSSQER